MRKRIFLYLFSVLAVVRQCRATIALFRRCFASVHLSCYAKLNNYFYGVGLCSLNIERTQKRRQCRTIYELNKYIFFILFAVLSTDCLALGIGVVPDSIYLDNDGESEEAINIINPNKIELEFEIKAGQISCSPQTGVVEAEGSSVVMCRAELENKEKFIDDSLIIIEAKAKENDIVGVIPAVAVKVEKLDAGRDTGQETGEAGPGTQDVKHENLDTGDDTGRGDIGDKNNEKSNRISGALSIQGEKKEGFSVIFNRITPDILSVALLALAIISVLVWSDIKERRKTNGAKVDHKTETDNITGTDTNHTTKYR